MIVMGINLLAVIASAVVGVIIDYVWYSPMLFGMRWSQLLGIHPESLQNINNFAWTFVGDLVIAAALAYALRRTNAFTFKEGARITFSIWLIVAASLYIDALWTGKSLDAVHIDVIYKLLVLMAMNGILIGWRKI